MAARSGILERVIEPARGTLRPEFARYLLTLDFEPADHARYEELAHKAQEGALTADEKALLEEFLTVNDFLAVLQAKARLSLGRAAPPSRTE